VDDYFIIYRPHPDATPEAERQALASVYRFLIYESTSSQKEAAHGSCPEARKESNGSGRESIPER
jgi:hypothetical protein